MFVYVPGSLSIPRTVAALDGLGLGALHDESLSLESADVLQHGPDDGQGVIFGWSQGPGAMLAYRKASQTWHRVVKDGELPAGRAWIGWDNDAPPTPESLRRGKQLPGEWLRLNDKHDWLIPLARQLPCVLGLDDDGQVTQQVAELYRPFWVESFDILKQFTSDESGVRVTWETGFSYAVRALQLNYRVTRDIVARLGLLTDQLLWSIPATVVSFQEICASMVQKKTEPVTPLSCAGSAA